MTRLEGALVLVTGASSGIGAATARAFADAGSVVVLVARTEIALDDVVTSIRCRGGEAHRVVTDVSDAAAVSAMAVTVVTEFGVPDVIVNNAGAGRFLSIEETSAAEAREMMAVPYLAAFTVTRAFVEPMIARGSGTILQINTPAAFAPWPGAVGYSAARFALRGFTEALRQDLRNSGITVSSVTPAKVSTAYFDRHSGAEDRIPAISNLIGTMTPEQVADVVTGTVERDRHDVHAPRTWRLLRPVTAWSPRLVGWLSWRTSSARRIRGSEGRPARRRVH
ncbi:SDR family NAD(P)-dependent oxidoreductase [Rhodococcus sp. NBC_00294]|uniref:SDR family NAD(P)-dependent oxidoreductase n=1 Tax=Rhodococcus sp. NBC_00294 TaxID=2976004 RepID=UPI002E2D25A5|nr:SDR family oxidoreductase [Rhodococcus sp. NBC_00294]